MKSKLLKKLAKSQKYLILAEIKRSQGLSVSQLCERISLSYMGVKQHCVRPRERRLSRHVAPAERHGPPREGLSSHRAGAGVFFPSEHTNFTAEILTSLEQVYGPAAPEKILFQIYQNLTVKLQGKITGTTLEETRPFRSRPLRDGGRLHERVLSQSRHPAPPDDRVQLAGAAHRRPVSRS